MKNIYLVLFLFSIAAIACNRSPKSNAGETAAEDVKPGFSLVEVWRSDTTLLVPECVLYDEVRNVIYVSNLNFEPRKKDGNGFISKLSPGGEIIELNWIGEMSSPKGMALVGEKLYVTDVDELIEMDVVAGTISGRWILEGSKMLNDIAADDSGVLYISDSDGNSIYRFENGDYEIWVDGLSAPNGLLFEPGRLLLASMGSEDFAAIDLETKEITVISEAIGKGDGIVSTGAGENYIVSDWGGQIFYIHPDGSREVLVSPTGEEQTADIGYIEEGKLVLVPTFFGNQVIAYRLEEK